MTNCSKLNISKFSRLIKLLVSATSFFYLYIIVSRHSQLADFKNAFQNLSSIKYLFLVIVFLLVIPNWSLESLKWKLVIKKIQPVDFKFSIKVILSALTLSLFTPNRIGEIPGRTIFLKKGNKRKGILATTMGSMTQGFITFNMGFIAYVFMVIKYHFYTLKINYSLILLILITSGILIFSFLHFINKKSGNIVNKKIQHYIFFLRDYKKREIILLILCSLLRYAVFIFQFYIFLLIFGVKIELLQGLLSIAITYLVMFITPFISVAELGVRGSASILCIGFFSKNIAGILLAGFSLWLLNIIIPTIIGGIIILLYRENHNTL